MLISRKDARTLALSVKPEVRKQALHLRSKGYSNYDISEELDLPYPHVVEIVLKQAVLESHSDPRKFQRQLEEARLEHLFRQAHQAFTTNPTVDWYDRLLKTSERKSKLLGLDSPIEQVITGKDGGSIKVESISMKGLSDEDLASLKALALKACQSSSNEPDRSDTSD